MNRWWGTAFAVLCGLLAAGLILLIARQPLGKPLELLPPPTPAPLVVHVTGAVLSPGVYALPPGTRVRDALAEAGGPLPEADLDLINLAALLQDGQQVWVPLKAATPAPGTDPDTLPDPTITGNPATAPGPVLPLNINQATQADLETLPGIGPKIAARILVYRQTNGPFQNIEEIQAVKGIGPAIFEEIKDLITVGGP